MSNEVAIDIETKIKQVISQMESPKPNKKGVLEHLQGAQELIGGATSAVGLIKILAEATEVIRRLF